MATDSFSRWDTQTLIGIAACVTPAHELEHYLATERGVWKIQGATATLSLHCEVKETVDASYLREMVVDQLENFGVTQHDVNRMIS